MRIKKMIPTDAAVLVAFEKRETAIDVLFGDFIRRRLGSMGRSVGWLSRKVGRSGSWAYNVACGRKSTTIQNLISIADALEVDPRVILKYLGKAKTEGGRRALRIEVLERMTGVKAGGCNEISETGLRRMVQAIKNIESEEKPL